MRKFLLSTTGIFLLLSAASSFSNTNRSVSNNSVNSYIHPKDGTLVEYSYIKNKTLLNTKIDINNSYAQNKTLPMNKLLLSKTYSKFKI